MPGPMVAGQRNTADIGAFGSGWAGLLDRFHQGCHVIDTAWFSSNEDFANRDMQVGGLIHAELDTTSLGFLDNPANIFGRDNRAGLGVGHQATRAKDTAQTTNFTHHIRRGDGHIKIRPAALDLGQSFIIISHKICTGLAGICRAIALSKDQNTHRLTQAMRQDNHIAHLLVGMARIHTQADMNFYSSIKLGDMVSLASVTASSGV